MKRFKIMFVSVVFALIFISLFVCYNCVAKGVTSGLYICSNIVIPSLFPLICLTSAFINTGVIASFSKYSNSFCKKIFNMSGYFLPLFLISLISSYPIGAILSNMLYENKKISIYERDNIALVSCSAGPSFVILAVGVNMLKSFECGVLLYCCHLLSSITVGLIVSRFFKYNNLFKPSCEKILIGDAVVKGVENGAKSIISICAYTVLFSAIINVFSSYIRFTPLFLPLVSTLEVTNACVVLSLEKVSLSVICAVLGFGGFSIIFQVSSSLKHNPPPMSKFVLVRLFHACLSYIYCEIALKFVRISIPVISDITPVLKTSSSNILFSLSLIFLLVVFLSFLNKSIEN